MMQIAYCCLNCCSAATTTRYVFINIILDATSCCQISNSSSASCWASSAQNSSRCYLQRVFTQALAVVVEPSEALSWANVAEFRYLLDDTNTWVGLCVFNGFDGWPEVLRIVQRSWNNQHEIGTSRSGSVRWCLNSRNNKKKSDNIIRICIKFASEQRCT